MLKTFAEMKFIIIIAGLIGFTGSSLLQERTIQLDPWSCQDRCNISETIPNGCQCNYSCANFGDCCDDYSTLCLTQEGSCKGKCDQVGTDPGASCQCNKICENFGDCCPDYEEECLDSSVPTNAELEALAEELLALDNSNNVAGLINVHLDGPVLLEVDPEAYEMETIRLLIALSDNYFPDTYLSEQVTLQELQEEREFVDAVFNTGVMQRAQQFLQDEGLPHGKDTFLEMWFGLYARGAPQSSSGFEHVFVGEQFSGEGISGLNNWFRWAKEEAAGNVTYVRSTFYADLGDKGSMIAYSYTSNGNGTHPMSFMYIGTSPELEMALMTVCFHARPNTLCPASFAKNKFQIQTYTIGSNNQYIASGYPDLF